MALYLQQSGVPKSWPAGFDLGGTVILVVPLDMVLHFVTQDVKAVIRTTAPSP